MREPARTTELGRGQEANVLSKPFKAEVADYCAIRRLDDDMRGFGSLWQPLGDQLVSPHTT